MFVRTTWLPTAGYRPQVRYSKNYSGSIREQNRKLKVQCKEVKNTTSCVFDFLTLYLYVTHTTGMPQLKNRKFAVVDCKPSLWNSVFPDKLVVP